MSQFIATIPNNAAGRNAIEHLREFGRGEFGITYEESLADSLLNRWFSPGEIRAARVLNELPYGFHTIDIVDGQEVAAVPKILRWHSDPTGLKRWRGHIEAIEPNVQLTLAAVGVPFTAGDMHLGYLKMLNVSAARRGGQRIVKVAVLDTGSHALSFVSDFYDLTKTASNLHPGARGQVDVNGHGTAMATLIHEVAPGATLAMVRIAEDVPEYLHVLAGVAVAVCDCQAEIVNLSLGFKHFGGTCGGCGANAISRSIALQKLLAMLTEVDPTNVPGFIAPIFVAATGNAGVATGFHYPAAFDYTIAVGSVSGSSSRSSFSNYGTVHPAYLVAPGGEDAPNCKETVGSGSTGDCFGTSVATAYVSGILALMRQDLKYSSLSRDKLIAALLKMCTLPAGTNANEYGRGVIRYS